MINLRSGKKQKSRLRKECNKKNSERINIHQREDYRTEDLPTVFDAKKEEANTNIRTQKYKSANTQIHKYKRGRGSQDRGAPNVFDAEKGANWASEEHLLALATGNRQLQCTVQWSNTL